MRATQITINKSNLIHNLKVIKNYAQNVEIIGVVKANAYGHGIIEVARLLRSQKVNILGVAFIEEAIRLRENGDNGEILVMVPNFEQEFEDVIKYKLQTVVSNYSSLYNLEALCKLKKYKAKVHLFIDTGMHRDGILFDNLPDFIRTASRFKNINIIGLLSHFANSESNDKSFALEQLKSFQSALKIAQNTLKFQYIHISNSCGIFNINAYQTAVRPGLSIHGLLGNKQLAQEIKLKPTLTLKSKVIDTKRVKKGETVGYSFKYIANEDINIALIPIGYGDGYPVSLSNRGTVLINGRKYPVIGSVCMDQIAVKLAHSPVKIGDEVVLIGKQGKHEITVYDLAKTAKTIEYEITTRLSERIPRIYI